MKHYLVVIIVLLSLAFKSRGQAHYDTTIKPGDTRLETYLPMLEGKRVALIINQTSKVNNESLLDILVRSKVKVVKVFVPEHGFRGTEDAGASIGNSYDSATQVPIISLYGNHKKPVPDDIYDVDVMVFDLQDVGVRFYTYISTLEYCMEACAQNKIKFIVLDRPNPNGFYVDGPVLEKEFKSFVGMQAIPIVHGLTVGEYARMLMGERWFNSAADLDLKVIKCLNYSHAKKYELPIAPSPNLKNMAAIYAYPSMCLFEGTPLSLGRGTDHPFLQYGCPEFEGKFNYTFTPRSMPGAQNPPLEDKQCFGELIGTRPEEVLATINNRMQLRWVKKAYEAYPEKDKFFFSFFVKLAGTPKLAAQIKSGLSEDEIRASWKPDLVKYKTIRCKYLLYDDFE
jgi:uncharacterized protein YbbC (DUF1343 family)